MSTTTARITADEFLALTWEDDRWRELIDGVVVVNEPLPRHAVTLARIIGRLQPWVEAGPGRGLVLTPTDVELTAFDVYGPDAMWIAERNRPDLDVRLPRVPELCVEVRSPSTWRYDVGRKRAVYEQAGLPELWLVDTSAETVLVFRRSTSSAPIFDVALELTSEETLSSPQLEGFTARVGDLFPSG